MHCSDPTLARLNSTIPCALSFSAIVTAAMLPGWRTLGAAPPGGCVESNSCTEVRFTQNVSSISGSSSWQQHRSHTVMYTMAQMCAVMCTMVQICAVMCTMAQMCAQSCTLWHRCVHSHVHYGTDVCSHVHYGTDMCTVMCTMAQICIVMCSMRNTDNAFT